MSKQSERAYILATDLTRLRIVKQILADVCPYGNGPDALRGHITYDEHRQLAQALFCLEVRLGQALDRSLYEGEEREWPLMWATGAGPREPDAGGKA